MTGAPIFCISVNGCAGGPDGVQSNLPDCMLVAADDDFLWTVAKAVAGLRLMDLMPNSASVPEVKTSMRSHHSFYQGVPVDRSELIRLPKHEWHGRRALLVNAAPSEADDDAFDWDELGDEEFNGEENFQVSSTWLVIDQRGFHFESWGEHTDEELHSDLVDLKSFPDIAERVEEMVLELQAQWARRIDEQASAPLRRSGERPTN